MAFSTDTRTMSAFIANPGPRLDLSRLSRDWLSNRKVAKVAVFDFPSCSQSDGIANGVLSQFNLQLSDLPDDAHGGRNAAPHAALAYGLHRLRQTGAHPGAEAQLRKEVEANAVRFQALQDAPVMPATLLDPLVDAYEREVSALAALAETTSNLTVARLTKSVLRPEHDKRHAALHANVEQVIAETRKD